MLPKSGVVFDYESNGRYNIFLASPSGEEKNFKNFLKLLFEPKIRKICPSLLVTSFCGKNENIFFSPQVALVK